MGPGRRVVRRVEAGAGEPAVVLEAGLNNGAASWQRVMPLLAPHLRVAAYDRAGLGSSDPAPGLVTIEPSGGVDACGEVEQSLRQFVGGLHRCVVPHAVE